MVQERNKLLITLLAPLSLLFIPLIAMLFTNQVNWGILDFMIGGVLLLGISLSFIVAQRIKASKQAKTIFLVVAITVIALLWIEMAVGIFGSPIAGS